MKLFKFRIILSICCLFIPQFSSAWVGLPQVDGELHFSSEIKKGDQFIWNVNIFNVSFLPESPIHDNSIVVLNVLKDPRGIDVYNFTQNSELNDYFELLFDESKIDISGRFDIGEYYSFWVGDCDLDICWDSWGGFSLFFLWAQTIIAEDGSKMDIAKFLDNSDDTLSVDDDIIIEEINSVNHFLYSVYDRSSGIFLERKENFNQTYRDGTVIYYEVDYKLTSNTAENGVKLSVSIFALVFPIFVIPIIRKNNM